MTFGKWPEEIHDTEEQQRRMLSACKAPITPVEIDRDAQTGVFSGKHGVYETSLDSCSCIDFSMRQLPCKHMYRLAHELLGFDLPGPVKTNKKAIQEPEPDVRWQNMEYISSVIAEEPPESYWSILRVLRAIQSTGRKSSLDMTVEFLERIVLPQRRINPKWQKKLNGYRIVIAGDLPSMSHEQATKVIKFLGGEVSENVSDETHYLICGENSDDQMKKAQKLNIPCWTEQEFFDLLYSEDDTLPEPSTLIRLSCEKPAGISGFYFVVTGNLPTMTRYQATEFIEQHGGIITGSVSKKTSYVVYGEDAGNKIEKAKELGIPCITEQELLEMGQHQ